MAPQLTGARVDAEARRRFDQAEIMLRTAGPGGFRPRCVAWLTRLGLERALDALWRRHNPVLIRCTKRAQLLALGRVVDGDTRYRAASLWSALSRAGHHHHYELTPTASELRSWLDEARWVAAVLHTAGRSPDRGLTPTARHRDSPTGTDDGVE